METSRAFGLSASADSPISGIGKAPRELESDRPEKSRKIHISPKSTPGAREALCGTRRLYPVPYPQALEILSSGNWQRMEWCDACVRKCLPEAWCNGPGVRA